MGNNLMDNRINKLLQVSENAFMAVNTVRQEVAHLGDRMDSVETTLDRFSTINSGQAKVLRKAANSRVRHLLPNDMQYGQLRSKYYSWLWNSYQDAFGITSYTDTRLKHFEAALDWINEWQPIRAIAQDELRSAALEAAAANH